MDTHDDPERPSPADGTGMPPPGWYQDPQGGWGRRWWDGGRWTDHLAVPTTPPAKDASRNLALVFTVEVALAVGAFSLAGMLVMGVDSCASAGCQGLYWNAWLLLMVAHVALLVVCGAAFLWARWAVVKLLAVFVLPIGMVTAWIVYVVMASTALDA